LLAKWDLAEPIAIATTLEVSTWTNPETGRTELVVNFIIHTTEGVNQATYRATDLNDLIGDLITVLKYLIEQGLDEQEGG
jgi:hypothetical protein